MCVYVDTQIYIYMYPVPVLFQLTCFLYGVFVKDIEMILFERQELILRWQSLFPMKLDVLLLRTRFFWLFLVIFPS